MSKDPYIEYQRQTGVSTIREDVQFLKNQSSWTKFYETLYDYVTWLENQWINHQTQAQDHIDIVSTKFPKDEKN